MGMKELKKKQEREKLAIKQKKVEDVEADLIDFNELEVNFEKKEESENEDDEEKDGEIISSFDQKQMKKERYSNLQRTLSSLDHKFAEIYCCPQIIDLQMKNQQNDMT